MAYRFKISVCPKCGSSPCGTSDTVLATASLLKLKDGSFEEGGDTKIHWDSQKNTSTDKTKIRLECAQCHEDWDTDFAIC